MSKEGITQTLIYSQLVAAVKQDHDIMLPNKAGPAVARLVADFVAQMIPPRVIPITPIAYLRATDDMIRPSELVVCDKDDEGAFPVVTVGTTPKPAWDGVLRPEDLSVTTFSTSGNSWGANERGIRITHMPTGISAECGTARSQHANKAIAMLLLEIALRKYST